MQQLINLSKKININMEIKKSDFYDTESAKVISTHKDLDEIQEEKDE